MQKHSQPKVSIIIPVYKVEAYIERCVRSLFSQTLDNLEYIFVDDSSPDKSIDKMLQVLEEYPSRKPQVKIIHHKKNQGVSQSRQDGVDSATGEYIIHCDPDDWVELDMYEHLYNKAKETNADLVLCDFIIESSNHKTNISQKPSAYSSEVVQCELFQNLYGATWNKLVKRSVIVNSGIKFNKDLSFCEDLYYFTELLNNELSIDYIAKSLYHYLVLSDSDSLIHRYNNQSFDKDVKLLNLISEKLVNRPALRHSKAHLSNSIVSRAFWAHIYTSNEFRDKCKYYRYEMNKYPQSIILRTIYNIACLGGYGFIYNIVTYIKKFKKQ